MKLCVIGLRGIPNVMGGIESHCQQLYPRMAPNFEKITIIARKPYVKSECYTFGGVDIVPLWTIKNKFLETFLHTFIAILYARFVIKPDVIHLHAIGPGLLAPLGKLLGMKVIVTHHGADYNRQKWSSIAKNILKLGEKFSIRFADKVIVVGNSLTESLKLEYAKYSQKLLHIPNGTVGEFSISVPQEALPSDMPIVVKQYVLTVARLVPEKGIHDLVEAYKLTDQTKKLVIVGAADHNDGYSEQLLSQASDNIIFAGRREGEQLKALYQYAAAFVLPSYHEGLPIVALEAISAGSSVLLSDIEPNLDIGLPESCYFPVGNVKELAVKLGSIDQQSLTVDVAALMKKYDWDQIAQQTCDVLDNIGSVQA